jgi:hypothetical protein
MAKVCARLGAASAVAAAVAWGCPASAQVTDAERAVARQLFHEGDDLQRAGKFADALDKFERAESAFSAPTNVVRIAECQAALGQLVESAESYRATLRMPVPPGSPAAFQTAIDQAKTELAQVEPRVPKLLVAIAPAGVAGVDVQIDSQHVSSALIGEPIPLDPGEHHVIVSAPGYANFEQTAMLRERDTASLSAALRPVAALPLPPPPVRTAQAQPPLPPPPPPIAPTAPARPASAAAGPGVPPPYEPPPPPDGADREMSRVQRPSRVGVFLGGHLGWEVTAGKLPTGDSTSGTFDMSSVSAAGLAYGLEAGLRLGYHWVLGIDLEHAQLGQGDLSSTSPMVTQANGSTTLLGASVAFVGNTERPSVYAEIGAAVRWFTLNETDAMNGTTSTDYASGELTLGLGIWIPVGPAVRLLPEVTLGLGSFDPPDGVPGTAQGHSFVMVGLGGFYGLNL